MAPTIESLQEGFGREKGYIPNVREGKVSQLGLRCGVHTPVKWAFWTNYIVYKDAFKAHSFLLQMNLSGNMFMEQFAMLQLFLKQTAFGYINLSLFVCKQVFSQ